MSGADSLGADPLTLADLERLGPEKLTHRFLIRQPTEELEGLRHAAMLLASRANAGGSTAEFRRWTKIAGALEIELNQRQKAWMFEMHRPFEMDLVAGKVNAAPGMLDEHESALLTGLAKAIRAHVPLRGFAPFIELHDQEGGQLLVGPMLVVGTIPCE